MSLVLLSGLAWGPSLAPADDRAARSREMAELVRSLRAYRRDGNARVRAELRPEPLLRWNDPTRENSDGSLWAFGRTGRPIAAVAVELYPDKDHGAVWPHEFVSLATGLVEVQGGTDFNVHWPDAPPPRPDGSLLWRPSKPGLTFHDIPETPMPAESESKRLRQLKALAGRFSATEYYDKTGRTYTLRLSPHPIHRYADANGGIVDGAIFALSHGTYPEALLVIEAQGAVPGSAQWRWAAARLTRADPTLLLDRKAVWTAPHPELVSSTDTYFSVRKVRTPPAGESAGEPHSP